MERSRPASRPHAGINRHTRYRPAFTDGEALNKSVLRSLLPPLSALPLLNVLPPLLQLGQRDAAAVGAAADADDDNDNDNDGVDVLLAAAARERAARRCCCWAWCWCWPSCYAGGGRCGRCTGRPLDHFPPSSWAGSGPAAAWQPHMPAAQRPPPGIRGGRRTPRRRAAHRGRAPQPARRPGRARTGSGRRRTARSPSCGSRRQLRLRKRRRRAAGSSRGGETIPRKQDRQASRVIQRGV